MKLKRCFCILITVLMLMGCEVLEEKSEILNQFIIVESYQDDVSGKLYITYDKDTKVMYYIWQCGSSIGNITPIYNTDGTIRVYEGNF